MADGEHCDVVYVRVEGGQEGSRAEPDDTEERSSSSSRTKSDDGEGHLLAAPAGAALRDVLVEAGFSPYTRLTERLNCGGRGLCGTCGVRIEEGPNAEHWHDALAERWGYPRLSCQVRLDEDARVRLAEKVVWGRRESE
jgi:ferredoxin